MSVEAWNKRAINTKSCIKFQTKSNASRDSLGATIIITLYNGISTQRKERAQPRNQKPNTNFFFFSATDFVLAFICSKQLITFFSCTFYCSNSLSLSRSIGWARLPFIMYRKVSYLIKYVVYNVETYKWFFFLKNRPVFASQ